jgi:hypothetical protein
MPSPWPVRIPAPVTRLTALALTLGLTACGERAGGTQSDRNAGARAAAEEPDGDGAPERPQIDPCALLTKQEISEQLLNTISPSERTNWTTTDFEIVPTEVDWGVSRRCEVAWRSREQVSGGTPVVRGLFNLMVFRSDGLGVPVRNRRPVTGAGAEIFRHQQVFYVTQGDYAVSLTDFKGTPDVDGNEHAGRVALLRAAASRLP